MIFEPQETLKASTLAHLKCYFHENKLETPERSHGKKHGIRADVSMVILDNYGHTSETNGRTPS